MTKEVGRVDMIMLILQGAYWPRVLQRKGQ